MGELYTPAVLLLQMETGTACNGKCTFCTHRNMTRSGTAKWSTIIHTLYHYAHYAQEICPFGMQEPFLDPRMSAILANCKQFRRSARTIIYSNMTVYNEDTWREIITRGTLDAVHISFYGADKATYSQIQPGLNYVETQENIKKLVRLRRKLKWRKPQICIQYILMPETVNKRVQFFKKWDPIVDEVDFVHYDGWHGDVPYNPAFEEAVWGPPHERVPCHRLWSVLNVHYDGTVVPCCLDYAEEMPLGNVLDNVDVWMEGEPIEQLRHMHLDGRWNEIPLCRDCTLWRYESPKEWRLFWEQQKLAPSAKNR